jgi:hypothetical protein
MRARFTSNLTILIIGASLGEGGALASLAVVGLIAHEALMKRALWPG